MKYDILIPYDNNNDESLKLALRSIERHVDYKDVYLVSPKKPDWIKNVKHIKKDDVHKSNKDANLFDKVFCAIDAGIGDFLFWSDDQIIMKPHDFTVVYNVRNPLLLPVAGKWTKRLIRTGRYLRDKHKIILDKNYDSHVPQLMRPELFEKIRKIDYQSGLGYTICTLYFGLNLPQKEVEQDTVKVTIEKELGNTDKVFAGWNDKMFPVAKKHFEKLFDKKSSFEV